MGESDGKPDTADTTKTRAGDPPDDAGTTSPELLDKIEAVAIERVEGDTWDVIAERHGYASGDSIRSFITGKHRDAWRDAYDRQRELRLDTVEATAIQTQIDLLKDADHRIRQSAAHSLLVHCGRMRAQKLQVDFRGKIRHDSGPLSDKSDEEVAELIRMFDERAAAAGADDQDTSPDGDTD
jgi:hypothetical protein